MSLNPIRGGYLHVEAPRVKEINSHVLTDTEARNLRPGQFHVAMTSPHAQCGIVREIWISQHPFHVNVHNDVLIDFRVIDRSPDDRGVRVTMFDDGRAVADYSEARVELRRKGWLRIDPLMADVGIDVRSFGARQHRAEIIEATDKLKSVEFWQAVAIFNDVTYNETYLHDAPLQESGRLLSHLQFIKAEDARKHAGAARDNMMSWVEILKQAMPGSAQAKVEAPAPVDEVSVKVERSLDEHRKALEDRLAQYDRQIEQLKAREAEIDKKLAKLARMEAKAEKAAVAEGVSNGN